MLKYFHHPLSQKLGFAKFLFYLILKHIHTKSGKIQIYYNNLKYIISEMMPKPKLIQTQTRPV